MRTKLLAAASIAACLGLAGCDDAAPPAPAPNTQAAAAPPCNCQTAAEAPVHHPAISRKARWHERHSASYSASYSTSEYDENESESADDRSRSRSYDRVESEGSGGEVWVDGYGRSHYVVASAATISQPPDDRARRRPWHGYDAKCDEKDKP